MDSNTMEHRTAAVEQRMDITESLLILQTQHAVVFNYMLTKPMLLHPASRFQLSVSFTLR